MPVDGLVLAFYGHRSAPKMASTNNEYEAGLAAAGGAGRALLPAIELLERHRAYVDRKALAAILAKQQGARDSRKGGANPASSPAARAAGGP